MEKRYKNDYFREMLILADECVENLTLAEKHISQKDSQSSPLHKIRQNLEKDYFTPIEREDIFSICCHLYEMNEAAMVYCAVAKESNLFSFYDSFALLTKMLKNLAETIKKIISALSKYPKTDELAQLFIECENIYKELCKALHNETNKTYNYTFSVIERCAVCCHSTALHIQYVLIKNS